MTKYSAHKYQNNTIRPCSLSNTLQRKHSCHDSLALPVSIGYLQNWAILRHAILLARSSEMKGGI